MKTSLITLLMVAGLATAGFGGSADAELKAIEQQWLDAYVKGDAAFIKGVEADDYTIVEPDGSVTTKADDVKVSGRQEIRPENRDDERLQMPDAGR